MERARKLHQRCVVMDTHCDTTLRMAGAEWDFAVRQSTGHVDIPRLREGGVGAVYLAVWAPGPVEPGAGMATTRRLIRRIHATARQHAADVALAVSAEDVRRITASGRIALLIGLEGGYLIEESLDFLSACRGAGVTYMTLTHGFHTSWADSSGVHEPLAPLHGGLTDFGREVVQHMNRLGMIVDVSHVHDNTFRDVLETSSAPVMATHSSCRAVAPHCRNLSDEMIRALADKGGTVQINFASLFIDPTHPPMETGALSRWLDDGGLANGAVPAHRTPLSVLVDHFDHALQLVGADHVGIGSDFDGVPAVPEGMEDCSRLPALTAALLERGYTESELEHMLGANALRVLEACQAAATLPVPPPPAWLSDESDE